MAHYSRSLLAGMVVLGSTGEAVMLDDAESREVLRAAAEATAPEKVLIAGVGRENVKATVELAEAAAEFRYDAVLVRPPSYYLGNMTPPPSSIISAASPTVRRCPCCSTTSPSACLTRFRSKSSASWQITPTSSASRIRAAAWSASGRGRSHQKRAPPQGHRHAGLRGSHRPYAGPAQSSASGSFVSANDLAGGAAIATAPPAVPIKTRTREVGFQVLCGSGSALFESLKVGASGASLPSAPAHRRPARRSISPGRTTT